MKVTEHASSDPTTAADKIFEYAYDHQNRWVRKTRDTDADGTVDESSVFVHDGNQIALRFNDTGSADLTSADLTNRYLWRPGGGDHILSDEQVATYGTPGEVLWTLGDQLGTVRDVIDNAGVVRIHRAFNAFGKMTSLQLRNASNQIVTAGQAGALDHLFAFTARPLDVDTDLQWNLHRWYDVLVGRWMSADPIGFAAEDANLYRYLQNGPTNATDPQGTIPLDTIWDLGNIVYDVAVGDYVSLTADVAALAIPYFPAGTTKLVKASKLSKVRRIDESVKGFKHLGVTYQYLGKNTATRYSKHFLGKNVTKWVDLTKSGPAKWAPGTTDAAVKGYIEGALKTAKKKGWKKPAELNGKVFDYGKVPSYKGKYLGASNGKCTAKIKLQVNSQGQIHAFPVD